MGLNNPKYGMGTLNQGNDDVKCYVSSSHVNTKAELVALVDVFKFGNEFGSEMLSLSREELAPQAVVEFTAETKGKLNGMLELSLVFENGKKENIKIKNYFNDEDRISAMKAAIIAKSAGAFGIASKVSIVNHTFSVPRS